ncbi:hypothetical protein BROUX41_000045 [Berkeleyomyces rouxiae]|uniref:uncharacterized protein n=1 Tax=Berkeleyomyces rouxiae TaxID=2035830 RepID=UPI003B7874A3
MSTPAVKFENSPTESVVSLPGQPYSPLFDPSSNELPTPDHEFSDPMDECSPESDSESDERPPEDVVLAALAASLSAGDIASAVAASSTGGSDDAPGADKKPVKKRKSWGQVLPEPKTNLPPRKRAKTADEKEQRRVERVLRNRRAAQSSRERKRLEVEALERRNKELETRISLVERANMILIEELNKARKSSDSPISSPALDALLAGNTAAMTSDLFMSQQQHQQPLDQLLSTSSELNNAASTKDNTGMSASTVDPASLSPQLCPMVDSNKAITSKPKNTHSDKIKSEPVESVMAVPVMSFKPANMTQRPAEMLCDLQCQLAGLSPSRTASQPSALVCPTAHLTSLLTASSALLSVCKNPLMQISMSLKTGSPLLPTPSILTAIVWLVTRPSTPTSITSTTSSSSIKVAPPNQLHMGLHSQRTQRSRSAFRNVKVKTLQAILTCSPSLARPLQDATMEVLRLASEVTLDESFLKCQMLSHVQREYLDFRLGTWFDGAPIPSREALLTLLWVLKLGDEQMKRAVDQNNTLDLSSVVPQPQPLAVSENSGAAVTTTGNALL